MVMLKLITTITIVHVISGNCKWLCFMVLINGYVNKPPRFDNDNKPSMVMLKLITARTMVVVNGHVSYIF